MKFGPLFTNDGAQCLDIQSERWNVMLEIWKSLPTKFSIVWKDEKKEYLIFFPKKNPIVGTVRLPPLGTVYL